LALSGLREDTFGDDLPSHVIAVPYAPQRALLERCAVAVSHGGANSFGECLFAGKPLLIVPLGHEQPLQAELAQRAGVGLSLEPSKATAQSVRKAFDALLGDGQFRRRAEEVGRAYRAQDGTARAAELLAGVPVAAVRTGLDSP
jgi:UDP:flavonoid glycosyltransferase YjiC (YdhE family)